MRRGKRVQIQGTGNLHNEKGVVFFRNINENTLEVPSQKEVKKWIGENEPDKYIKYFGEVEEG